MAGAAVAVAVAAVLGIAAPAQAHQPLFVDDDTSGPPPTIEDGMVSFATYGRIDAPGGEVAVALRLAPGDDLVVEVLVPDRPPEADRASHEALSVAVAGPDGSVTPLEIAEPTGSFDEPFTGTSYLRLAEQRGPAQPGTYEVRATSTVPTRLVLVTGVREEPGIVDGYDGPGVEALATWYATPPAAGRGDALDAIDEPDGDGPGGPGATDGGSSPADLDAGGGAGSAGAGERGASPDTGAGAQRDLIGRSAGWGLLVAVLAMMGFISLLALRPWRRRGQRRVADPPR